MNHLNKVIVIIPCYNRAKYVEQTVDSVLKQTYPNIELVCVDDGSTDDTLKILECYGNRITLLQHPGGVNKGQSASINLGMRSTQSEYVAILDSDDLFAPRKIEKQVDYLEQHPEIGLVYSNGYITDENGEKLNRFYDEDHIEASDPERVLMACYFMLPSNSLVRRSAFQRAGEYDETLRAAEDHDMAIRLAEVALIIVSASEGSAPKP